MKAPIIALGRQFGSGGREIGKHLAERLNVRCYDRELITLAAQKAEVREELFAGREEKAPNPWLFTGIYEGGPQVRKGQPAEDILFEMQSRVILELAQMGPCIIVGRCADAVLRSAGIPAVSLFICAPFEDRVRRRMEIGASAKKRRRLPFPPGTAASAVILIDCRLKRPCPSFHPNSSMSHWPGQR